MVNLKVIPAVEEFWCLLTRLRVIEGMEMLIYEYCTRRSWAICKDGASLVQSLCNSCERTPRLPDMAGLWMTKHSAANHTDSQLSIFQRLVSVQLSPLLQGCLKKLTMTFSISDSKLGDYAFEIQSSGPRKHLQTTSSQYSFETHLLTFFTSIHYAMYAFPCYTIRSQLLLSDPFPKVR